MNEQQVRQIINSVLIQGQYKMGQGYYHAHNGLDAPKIAYNSLLNSPNTFCVATTTTGTTPVNVFGSKGAKFNLTFTGAFLISNDTTAGNITVKNNGSNVAVIAKGTTAGAMVGATSLTNTVYTRGNPATIVSSSVGNATVFLTFST